MPSTTTVLNSCPRSSSCSSRESTVTIESQNIVPFAAFCVTTPYNTSLGHCERTSHMAEIRYTKQDKSMPRLVNEPLSLYPRLLTLSGFLELGCDKRMTYTTDLRLHFYGLNFRTRSYRPPNAPSTHNFPPSPYCIGGISQTTGRLHVEMPA
ncbi:hypothetical protein BC629DRAFT_557170 [Irpex lacteus]|nr:hypothetical protein BC629DRAFT_557170 [Irpex lacteus]